MKLNEIKQYLRNGPYAWPGGYPLYFVTHDGAALSFATVRENWREVVSSQLADAYSGSAVSPDWLIAGCDINWENGELVDDHTGERIESAYAD